MAERHERSDPPASTCWLAPARAPGAALDGAITADFAIVGAGFSGLAAAYFLKRAEPAARVVVLDAGRVGAGASARSAGFVSTDFGLSLAATVRTFGRACARDARRYLEQAVELVERVVHQNRIACEYERTGLLRVATTPAFALRVREELELTRRLGLSGGEWLDAPAVRAQLDSPLFLGAAFEPRAALLNPARLVAGLQDALERAGVQIFEQSPALRVERRIGRLFVRTPRGSVLAEKLAITTNAFSDALPGLRRKQAAVQLSAIASEPLRSDQLEALGWRRRQGLVDARTFPRFCRLTGDNRLLFGGGDVGVPLLPGRRRELPASSWARLEADARVLLPALARVRFPFRWSGPISVPLQLVPAVGYLGTQRIVYSLGCMGHGIALAHLNGWTISDLLRQEKTERTEVFFVNRRVLPWPPAPLRLALTLAVRGVLNAEDAWCERALPDVPRAPSLRPVPPLEPEPPPARERERELARETGREAALLP